MDDQFKKWIRIMADADVLDAVSLRNFYVPYQVYDGSHQITNSWPAYIIYSDITESTNVYVCCSIVREKATKKWWLIRPAEFFSSYLFSEDNRFEKIGEPHETYEDALMYLTLAYPFLLERFTVIRTIHSSSL